MQPDIPDLFNITLFPFFHFYKPVNQDYCASECEHAFCATGDPPRGTHTHRKKETPVLAVDIPIVQYILLLRSDRR